MSKRLPVLSSRDILRILRKHGFWQTGQTGSHIYVTDGKHKVTIPQRKEMKKGTMIHDWTVRVDTQAFPQIIAL